MLGLEKLMRHMKLLVVVGAVILGGCFLVPVPKPAAGPGGHGSSYEGLGGKSVAIVIYAPGAIMDEYPGAREEISTFVTTRMREHMPTTRLVDPREIIDWQNRTFNWRNLSGVEIGKHFGVERVLTINVLTYATRQVIGPSEMQGRLRAQCRVYEVPGEAATGPGEAGATYVVPEAAWTSLIDVAWPAGKALDPTQTNEAAARLRTLDSFSDRLVHYFYDFQTNSIQG